jgi:PAS domain S-box-containing protein
MNLILMELVKGELAFELLDKQPAAIVFYKPLWKDNSQQHLIDFELVYCNQLAAAMINAMPGQLVSSGVGGSGQLHDSLKEKMLPQLSNVFLTGETTQDEYYDTAAGKHMHVTRNKVAGGVLTTTRDISDSVIIRKEKDRQAELASEILNNALDGWFYCEAIRNRLGTIEDFRFVMINPAFTKMVKMTPEQVIGKTHLQLFPTSRLNGVHQMNCRVVNQHKAERKQLLYKGDQIDAWYDIVVSPLGENGLLVTFADITHTKQKELEAANLAETLRTVINNVQVAIFTFKPEYNGSGDIVDFRFTMVNPAMSAYVAQEPETLVGALGSEWFPGYLHNGVFEMYRDTFITGETQRKEFHYNVDGIDVYLDLQCTRLGEEVLVTFTDFTPLQLAQLELQRSIRELQRSNQNLEEFTRAASHDLKEPIRKIQLFSDRLRHSIGSSVDAKTRDLFDRMENAASRMRLLIDDLLEYSYVTSSPFQQEAVDINEIVQLVLTDLELIIEESGAVVDCENLTTISGNRRQLQQLFLNLVSNSIKYSKPAINPHIFIHARKVNGSETNLNLDPADIHRDYTLIEVADNGIGFDMNDAERIFHVFTRLHNGRQYSGTGIGLAIANRVMENHSGYIFARGVKGQGATFTLLFPE